jgi:hypothetical protein
MLNFLKKVWPIALFVIFVIGCIEEIKTWNKTQKYVAIISFFLILCLMFVIPQLFGIELIY